MSRTSLWKLNILLAILIIVGVAQFAISRRFDGFVSGMFIGFGASLIIGAICAFVGIHRAADADDTTEPDRRWLPSRDGPSPR